MHLGQVQTALAALPDVRMVAAMPGTTELLAALATRLELTVPLLSDPAWDLHRRYGMKRGSKRAIFLSISTWAAYARLVRSWRWKRPSEDVFQLGGAAIVGADGTLVWIHRSRHPADYTDPQELAGRARSAARRH